MTRFFVFFTHNDFSAKSSWVHHFILKQERQTGFGLQEIVYSINFKVYLATVGLSFTCVALYFLFCIENMLHRGLWLLLNTLTFFGPILIRM